MLRINASDALEYANMSAIIHAITGFLGSASMTSSDELPIVSAGSPGTEYKTNMGAVFNYVANNLDTSASGAAGDTDDNKAYIHFGDLCIQWGRVSITPSAANTPTSKAVTFPVGFSAVPFVLVSPITSVPATTVTGWSCATPSATAVTVYVTRTNTTATALFWIAIGYKA
jgi:hypothetical protein